ncbi:hypothetical protein BH09BAC1_BH09BAC1_22880 [soil metagenome]
MALLINWLDAIGALVLLAFFYNNALLAYPEQAAFASLIALVFLALSYVVRVNSVKMVPLSHGQALAGLLVVMFIVGMGIYFAVPQIEQFTTAGQYAVVIWMFFLDALILIESLLSFKNSKHPLLENRLHELEVREEQLSKQHVQSQSFNKEDRM